MRRQLAVRTNLFSVPIEFVRVIHEWHEESERRPGAFHIYALAIPGKTGIAGMLLRAPGIVTAELLPAGIVESRVGPRRIVAKVELPATCEGNGAGARI